MTTPHPSKFKIKIPKIDSMLVVVVVMLAILMALLILPALQLHDLVLRVIELQRQHDNVIKIISKDSMIRDKYTDSLVKKAIQQNREMLAEIVRSGGNITENVTTR